MAALLKLERCEICQGRGWSMGIFHQLECAGCNGGGIVTPAGEALEYPALVTQLRLRLRQVEAEARALRSNQPAAEPARYIENRRGAGGANFTGD